MTDDSMQASAPAAHEATPMPAAQTPAQETYHEQPAETQEHYEDHFQDEPAEEPTGLGDILDEARPKKLSGSARAKLKQEHLQNEIRQERELRQAHEQRIAELERYIQDDDARRRSSDSERQAEAQRKRTEAHLERIKGAKSTITDFDRVMAKMAGAAIHNDLVEDVLSSDQSHLLTYHLANHPEQLEKLNRMPDRERAREIGRLEASLKLPEGKKQTTAPPPPTHLRGGAAPDTDLAKADMVAYVAARKRQGFGQPKK